MRVFLIDNYFNNITQKFCLFVFMSNLTGAGEYIEGELK